MCLDDDLYDKCEWNLLYGLRIYFMKIRNHCKLKFWEHRNFFFVKIRICGALAASDRPVALTDLPDAPEEAVDRLRPVSLWEA